MIRSLHIENIAVVKSLDIDFCDGMTVLTGETGAGKSIIIDSLGLLLGAKADKELIRSGETHAEVSALFSEVGEGVLRRLGELGFEADEDCVMLSRSLGTSSSARINGRAVTVGMLREIGGMLFNIHGQNDNQQLLNSKNHIALLDSFADNGALFEEYSTLYGDMLAVRGEIAAVKKDAMESERLREVLKFQIADIDAVKLKEGEEEALEELVKKLRGAEKINKACLLVDKAVNGTEKMRGAAYLSEAAADALNGVSDAIPEAAELADRLMNVKYELEDIAECTRDISELGEGDPTVRLDKAEGRLSAIAKLKRKYGSTVAEVLAFRAEAAEKLYNTENAEERIAELEEKLSGISQSARACALKLREKRIAAARTLSACVCRTLDFLDMPGVRFEVGTEHTEDFCARGLDRAEFLVSTNVGEPLLPMAKIASGGELARIMLALKNALNECDGIKTVIFDEIDTGISGKTSRKVGMKLKEIARASQVLCVTHSAQIASLAHSHFKIYKSEAEGRVSTSLIELDREGRINETARILGGIEITDTVRSAAEEMIAEGKAYE